MTVTAASLRAAAAQAEQDHSDEKMRVIRQLAVKGILETATAYEATSDADYERFCYDLFFERYYQCAGQWEYTTATLRHLRSEWGPEDGEALWKQILACR